MDSSLVCACCAKPATLQCPRCLELNLEKDFAAYCSQDCFKVRWIYICVDIINLRHFTIAPNTNTHPLTAPPPSPSAGSLEPTQKASQTVPLWLALLHPPWRITCTKHANIPMDWITKTLQNRPH